MCRLIVLGRRSNQPRNKRRRERFATCSTTPLAARLYLAASLSAPSKAMKGHPMRVKEIMTSPVVTCTEASHLNDVARAMWDCDCGAVPIVDEGGRLCGILTDRDICMAAYTQGRPIQEIAVGSTMAKHVLVCHVDDSLDTAEQLMREGQVRRIPVIDNDGRPAGIVSLNDVTRAAGEQRRSTVDREVVEIFAAVGEPRLARQHSPSRSRPLPA
jgi:CBS domain-containing protein